MKKTTVLYRLVVWYLGIFTVQTSCPVDWAEYKGECLYFGNSRQRWLDAEVRKQSSRLARIINWLIVTKLSSKYLINRIQRNCQGRCQTKVNWYNKWKWKLCASNLEQRILNVNVWKCYIFFLILCIHQYFVVVIVEQGRKFIIKWYTYVISAY